MSRDIKKKSLIFVADWTYLREGKKEFCVGKGKRGLRIAQEGGIEKEIKFM